MKLAKSTKALTRKQKAFADELISNPKQSATKAALKSYNTTYETAKQIAHENLTKPNILKYLSKYEELAEITVIDVMQNSRSLKDEPSHAQVALRAADSVLDRLRGKATQRTEVTSTSVNLNLDLSDVVKGS